jgi:hypothetical protein
LFRKGAASEPQSLEAALRAEVDEEEVHLEKEPSQTDHDGKRYPHTDQAPLPH